jgi:flagellar biogenesis protein FliO
MPKHPIETIVNTTITNTSFNNSEIYLDVYYGASIQDVFHNLTSGLFPVICFVLATIWVVVFIYTSFKLIRHCIKQIIQWIKNRKQKRSDEKDGL